MNEQISDDPVYSKYGRIGEFVNPPIVNVSDELVVYSAELENVINLIREKKVEKHF